MSDDNYKPRVLAGDEIEMVLESDRRHIDRHILFSLNRLADAHEKTLAELSQHQRREDSMIDNIEALGGIEAISRRAIYVDEMIERSQSKRKMMDKVSQSALTWALIAFLSFLVTATWDSIVRAVKIKLGG